MKKILLILIILFIPFFVNAKTCDDSKISISSISVEEKTDNVIEISEATANGRNINVNLNIKNVNDSIKYKVVIRNDSDEEYVLDKNSININSNYIKYALDLEGDSTTIKGKSSKTVYLVIKYEEEVPESAFVSGKYNETKTMSINLSNEDISNPKTGDQTTITIIKMLGVSLALFIVCTVLINNKKVKLMIVSLGFIIMIPFTIDALCQTEIKINSKVTISDGSPSSFKLSCNNDQEYYFYEGMTFRDWIQSDYYVGDVEGEYETLEQCISVWGNNKGCASKTKNIYSIENPYPKYTLDQAECQRYSDCTTVNNMYIYNLPNEEEYYDVYESKELCEENYDESECHLVSVMYKYTATGYADFETLEQCNYALIEGESCILRTIEIYSPNYRAAEDSGWSYSIYNPDGIFYFAGDGYMRYFDYNDLIEKTTYACYAAPGECVSPDSNILSTDRKTIKAKDIKENDSIIYYDFNTNKNEIGKVNKVYIHKNANNFVKYVLEDNTYLDVTDYHPIYTKNGWKSFTNRNGYPKPIIGDLVKTNNGYKKIVRIEVSSGNEDYYDFEILDKNGNTITNYYANGVLVQGSY